MSIMTIITIAGLRGLPAMAVMGWQSIILYLLPAVVFFVPSALVSAELGATYEGGIYQWVKEGLGKRFGFLAIWMQWIHNVVWHPAQLAFVAAAAASAVGLNRLTDSGVYITAVIIVVFWWAVWLALKGGNLFAKVASAAGLVGTIIPACLLLILGAAWLLTGQHISTTLTHSSPLPTFTNFASFALIVQNVLAFAGMEVNAVHAQQMDHPKRYTRVVGIAFVSALAIFIVPTLILAMVLPRNVNLSDGTVIAFQTMFSTFHIGFMGDVAAINLRRQHKTGNSGYRAPALYVMAGVGIVACVCAFVMTFVPAAGQTGIPTSLYPVITGLVVAALAIPSVALFHIAHDK